MLRDVRLVKQEGAVVALEAGEEGAQPLLLVFNRCPEPQPVKFPKDDDNFQFSLFPSH